MPSNTWDDDRHVLVVNLFPEDIEIEVEHPQSCKVYAGCSGPCFGGPDDKWHVDTYYDCPLGYEIDAIGPDEALFGYSMYHSYSCDGNLLTTRPENVGPVWMEVCRQLMDSDEARVPLKIHYWGGTDYWGEWDHGFEFTIKEES
jgi:hypothetical protein